MPSVHFTCIRCDKSITEECKTPNHRCKRGLCRPCVREILAEAYATSEHGTISRVYEQIIRKVERAKRRANGNKRKKVQPQKEVIAA